MSTWDLDKDRPIVRAKDGTYWVVFYEIHSNAATLLVCYRDGVRRTFVASDVEYVK